MKRKIIELWHDPVWSKVIAGVILAIGSLVIVYFLNLLTVVKSFAALCVEFVLSTTVVPNLVLIIGGFLSIPTAVLILFLIWKKFSPPNSKSVNIQWWDVYTSDLFFGLRWRWKYSSGVEHRIYEVTTFCPNCDYQVYHKKTSIWDAPILFYCDCCKQEVANSNETYAALEDKTIRHVHQKIRKGTWTTQNIL